MLPSVQVQCPYCGELIDLVIDNSVPEEQYVEDCQVCCRPIVVTASIGDDGEPSVHVAAEDDA